MAKTRKEKMQDVLTEIEQMKNRYVINELITFRKFTYGFHLGSMLMLEMLYGKGEMSV